MISTTTYLYFFSALAQCAAGLMALVAVFVVFRLQANSAEIIENYGVAKSWLRHANYIIQDTTPQIEIDENLKREINNKKDTKAQQIYGQIQGIKKIKNTIVDQVIYPLRIWATILLLSLVLVFLADLSQCYAVLFITITIVTLAGTGYALLSTMRFMRWCLPIPEHGESI